MTRKDVSQPEQAASNEEASEYVGRIYRGQLLRGAGLGILGAFAGLYAGPAAAEAADISRSKPSSVEGTWHVNVQVDGTPTPFDTLYSFAPGGVFIRVDGRNNAPSLGNWISDGKNGVIFTFLVFSFATSGQRAGTISAVGRATVKGDALSGPWSATGLDMSSGPLAGFPKSGTFDGVRIKAKT